MLDIKRSLRCRITPLEAYSPVTEKSVNKLQQHKGQSWVMSGEEVLRGRVGERGTLRGLGRNRDENGPEQKRTS